MGMLLSALFVLLFTLPLSSLVGIEHPFLRYAAPFFTMAPVDYSAFNGFGAYTEGFHWRMLYSASVAILFIVGAYLFWSRDQSKGLLQSLKTAKNSLTRSTYLLLLFGFLAISMNVAYVMYETELPTQFRTAKEEEKWAVDYELKYKQFEQMDQPSITAVYSEVELYPNKQKYQVRAVYTIKNKQPFFMISKSGGARMMEAGFSLMQMAKTSAKLALLSEAKLPYISLLTDPTTGGVTASFAMLGDFNISEPGALIGFAGPRVIKETIGKDLPEKFQTAEFVLEHGFLDFIVDRKDLKDKLSSLLRMIKKREVLT